MGRKLGRHRHRTFNRDAERIRVASVRSGLGAWTRLQAWMTIKPMVRGFWVAARDRSALGGHLTLAGNVDIDLSPYLFQHLVLDGSGDYAHVADTLSLYRILGTESYVDPALRGLTFGGWYRLDSGATPASTTYAHLSKWDGASNKRSYTMYTDGGDAGALKWAISSTGTSTSQTFDTGVTPVINEWYFAVAQFDPSADMYLWHNGTRYSVSTSVASIDSNDNRVEVGAHNTGGSSFDGRVGPQFIAASYIPEEDIRQLYQIGKSIFNTG